jgi:hypothetical protein
VELQEEFAACQAREARLEASLQNVTWERLCWEAGTFAGLAYGLTQHILRPVILFLYIQYLTVVPSYSWP